MKDRTFAFARSMSSRRRGGLQVGQAVEVRSGVMAGLCGVLERFTRQSHCIVRLDGVERGVLLVVAAAALMERRAELAANSSPGAEIGLQSHRRSRLGDTGK